MAGTALALKYRPKHFDELVEQFAPKQILKQQIASNQLKRVLLFTGRAGSGKTTSARIFANDLEQCKVNIIELNIADHNGVDDMRLILDKSKSRPLQGKYKIFVMDEFHMATPQAQNALLKLFEEPPEYCIYIMCTTDPQKILGTILSRAYRYDFQNISYNGILERLRYICNNEKNDPNGCGIQSWEDAALAHIAKISNGGMRDAITLLDKVISFSKDVTLSSVIQVLGSTGYEIQFAILSSILNKSEEELVKNLEELYRSGTDLKLFVKNFLGCVLDVSKYISTQMFDYIDIPNVFTQQLDACLPFKDKIKNLLHTLVKLNSDMKWETNPKVLLETILLLEVL